MGRTVGLILKEAGEAAAKGFEDGIADAENGESTEEKKLTKAEVIEKLTEKGIEFSKRDRLEDLMKLLEDSEEGADGQAG